jgi:hypothetical protein
VRISGCGVDGRKMTDGRKTMGANLEGLRATLNNYPRGETRDKLEDILDKIRHGHAGGREAMMEMIMKCSPGGCPRGQIAPIRF